MVHLLKWKSELIGDAQMASFFERDDWIPKGCLSRSNVESNVPPLLPLSSPFQRRLVKDTRGKSRRETLSFSLYSFSFPVTAKGESIEGRPAETSVLEFGKRKEKEGKKRPQKLLPRLASPLLSSGPGLVYPLAAGREETE